MTILSADLRFFAAQYPTDDAYGGGPMSANLVQDGVSANVFPLIGPSDGAIGRLQLRKAYAAVLSANTDLLINTAVHVRTPPIDEMVDVVLFAWGDALTTRSAAAAALATFPYKVSSPSGSVSGSGPSYTLTGTMPAVGDRLILGVNDSLATDSELPLVLTWVANVASVAGSVVTFVPSPAAGVAINRWYSVEATARAPKACGAAEINATVTASDTVVSVSRLEGRVVPDVTPYPTSPNGIASAGLKLLGGLVPIFRVGELVQIRNAAGTTSEIAQVVRLDFDAGTLEFAAPLVNGYAIGSRVSSLVQLGELQAVAGSSFSQQTWTRVFSDTIIGNPIGANYNRTAAAITVTNEGAETERWAIVFTSATDFKLIGERFGQIATGSTASAFLPTNPITSQPYFSIPSAGWGTGWAAGNVLRFNTVGARAPFWAARCISPVPTETTDGAIFEMRGAY
jgi:hypothetical protein